MNESRKKWHWEHTHTRSHTHTHISTGACAAWHAANSKLSWGNALLFNSACSTVLHIHLSRLCRLKWLTNSDLWCKPFYALCVCVCVFTYLYLYLCLLWTLPLSFNAIWQRWLCRLSIPLKNRRGSLLKRSRAVPVNCLKQSGYLL